MRGPPEPHHVLKEKGLLHQWQPGALVELCTHDKLIDSQPICHRLLKRSSSNWKWKEHEFPLRGYIFGFSTDWIIPQPATHRNTIRTFRKRAVTLLSRWQECLQFSSLTSGWECERRIPWGSKWPCYVKYWHGWLISPWRWSQTWREWWALLMRQVMKRWLMDISS